MPYCRLRFGRPHDAACRAGRPDVGRLSHRDRTLERRWLFRVLKRDAGGGLAAVLARHHLGKGGFQVAHQSGGVEQRARPAAGLQAPTQFPQAIRIAAEGGAFDDETGAALVGDAARPVADDDLIG